MNITTLDAVGLAPLELSLGYLVINVGSWGEARADKHLHIAEKDLITSCVGVFQGKEVEERQEQMEQVKAYSPGASAACFLSLHSSKYLFSLAALSGRWCRMALTSRASSGPNTRRVGL